MSKPLVYVASPYTAGDCGLNTRFQCTIFDMLLRKGIVTPIVPLWSHFQHFVHPLPYEMWMDYDHEIIRKCDALLRLGASYVDEEVGIAYFCNESSGADREVKHAKSLNIPVFYSIPELYSWAQKR